MTKGLEPQLPETKPITHEQLEEAMRQLMLMAKGLPPTPVYVSSATGPVVMGPVSCDVTVTADDVPPLTEEDITTTFVDTDWDVL